MQSLAVRPIELSLAERPDQGHDVTTGGFVKCDETCPTDLFIAQGLLVRRYQQVWSHARASVADIYCEDGLDFRLKFEGSAVLLPLEEVGGHVDIGPASIDVKAAAGRTGIPVTLLPKGQEITGRSGSLKFLRLFILEVDERHHLDRDEIPLTISGPARNVYEPRLSKICRLLAQECRFPDSNGCAYADSLVLALGMALPRLDEDGQRQYPKGGLAPWQLRRVQDFMIENIAEVVSNGTLAELAEISMTHFNREFKASVGCAPHQWMTEKRIERAKRFLLSGEMPIAEISLTLGFCDQAHFSRVFRKTVGDTPLTWQKTRRG